MAIVNKKNVDINNTTLADVLVKVLKKMLDRGMISIDINDKTKIIDVVHRVICNRENEWGENDSEEKLIDEVLTTFKLVG
tara:strand:+ start:71 stop:310 length:240 start_codon:yes stop_codon:yes gene_type:complete